jgi:hypothetical protein
MLKGPSLTLFLPDSRARNPLYREVTACETSNGS